MARMKGLHATAIFAFCAAVYFAAPMRLVMDSNYSMLLGESLCRHGTFKLDRYFQHPERHWPRAMATTNLTYHVYRHGGHIYYCYPPGSSVLSIPLVLAAKAAGVSPSHPRNGYDAGGELKIERAGAALVTALAVTLLFLAARGFLDSRRSAAVALVTAFASGFFSTASRVMWSHTWGVCLLAAAILMLARAATGGRLRPVLLATVLAWLYFTRPTFSLSIIAITVFVLVRYRREFLALALTGAGWFALFVAFSHATSGHLLPPYFLLGGTMSLQQFLAGLSGTLLSPARGMFVYSPAVVIAFWLAARNRRTLSQPGLATVAAIATALHIVTVAAWPIWAAGFCYGARYGVDFVPWIALLAALGWQAALARGGRDNAARAISCLLIAVSLAMQTIGAFSESAWRWNIEPDSVDENSPRIWSWRDAPFVRPFEARK